MKVSITISEMQSNCNDWDSLCEDVGLNPWCLNEGLASGDEVYLVDMEVARRHGLLRE